MNENQSEKIIDIEFLESGDSFALVEDPEAVFTVTGTIYPGSSLSGNNLSNDILAIETDKGDLYLKYFEKVIVNP